MSKETSLEEVNPSQHFRAGLQRAIQRYQLGTLLCCYTYSRWFWLLLFFSLFFFVSNGFGVYESLHTYTIEKAADQQYILAFHPKPDDPIYTSNLTFEQEQRDNIFQYIGGIPTTIIFLFGSFAIVRQKVYLCRAGLLYRRTFKNSPLHWEDITELTDEGNLYLRCADGSSLVIQNFLHNFAELRLFIAKEVLSRLLPGVIAQYESGEPVIFGDVRVDTSGITDRAKSFSWEQFDAIQFTKGGLVELHSGDKWIKWNVGRQAKSKMYPIPNTFIFVDLVKYALERHKGDASFSK